MRKLVVLSLVCIGLTTLAYGATGDNSVPAAYSAVESHSTGSGGGAQTEFANVQGPYVDEMLYFSSKFQGQPIRPEDTAQLIKQYGHNIELALSRWSIDHDLAAANPHLTGNTAPRYFPYDLEQIVRGKYLERRGNNDKGYYPNPVVSYTADRFNAVNVAPGDWSWDSTRAGNFTYIYNCNPEGYVVGYDLYFYGASAEAGFDINGDGRPDGVIMHLASGLSYERPAELKYFWNGQPVTLP